MFLKCYKNIVNIGQKKIYLVIHFNTLISNINEEYEKGIEIK